MSSQKKAQHTEVVSWEDDSIKGSNFLERPDIYKGKSGYTDILRILTLPISHFICAVNPPNNREGAGFSAVSLADHEDIKSGIVEGSDTDARKRAEATCPMVERGFPIKRRFVCLVHHVQRSDSNGRSKRINQFLPMVFDGSKHQHIRMIAQSLPTMASGKRRPLHAVELQVTCTDAKFQKMNFSLHPTQTAKWSEIKILADEFFADGWNAQGTGCEMIEAVLQTDERQRLIASINRVLGKGEFGDAKDDSDEWVEDGDESDETPAPGKPSNRAGRKPGTKAGAKPVRSGKPARGPRKPAPADDDDDESIANELDESLDDADIEDYEEED